MYRVFLKKKNVRAILRKPFPKSKIGLPNLDFHEFFCSKQLLHPKRHQKENCLMAFEENRLSCYFKTFRKDKIGLPNNNFHQFFCNKRLIQSRKHIKGVYVSYSKKIVRAVFEIFRSVSFPVCPMFLLVFQFSPKPRNIICTIVLYCR